MKWAAKLLFVGFLLICFPCCKAWNQQQKSLGSLILVYLYVCFLLFLPLLCGLIPSAHKNITVIQCVSHSTKIAHTPCHLHILEWSVCFQLHFSVKSVLELLWRIELKCVEKTMCDVWVKSALRYISKESAVCVFTKMWKKPRMWGWNPHIFYEDTKNWQIAQ
jgi:hypothetical protein